MNIIQRPYHLLLVAAIILLITSFIEWNYYIDIHLHDTYYVLPAPWIYWEGVVITALLWVVYHLTFRILLQKTLTWIHIIVTIISPILLRIWYDHFFEIYSPVPHYYIAGDLYAGASINLVVIILIFFVTAQVLFLVNLIGGAVRALVRK